MWNLNNFIKDLSLLNLLLQRYEIPLETSSLFILEGKLQSQKNFGFKVENITFNLDESMTGTIPNEIKKFSIFLTHSCILDTTKNFQTQDPFLNDSGYSFIIDIIGYKKNAKDEYHLTIRLDRHITGGDTPKVCHPIYHIQYGGDSVASRQTGELLLMSSPRIAHPPLDLFLGIHFILDNFFNKTSYPMIKKLFQDYDYQSILVRAQQRLWEPYFKAFTINTTHQDYTIENVFPLYTHIPS